MNDKTSRQLLGRRPSLLTGLFLLGLCFFSLSLPGLAEGGGGGPDPVEALAAELSEGQPEKRRSAVRRLSALGTPRAWEHVITALADPAGQVADEAAWRLAALDDPSLLAKLLGRTGLASENELVRRRVAELVGRVQRPLDGELLCKRFSRRDPETTRRLVASIERLAEARLLKGKPSRLRSALEKLCRQHPDVRVQAAAVCALAAVVLEDPIVEARPRDELLKTLRRASQAKAPKLRVAALLAAEALDPMERMERARTALRDPALAVRLAAIDQLRFVGTREAAELLVTVLAEEESERARLRALEILRAFSGLKHRADPRPWGDWVRDLPADWRGNARVLVPSRAARGRSRAGFAGLPLMSDRICFLVDFSGSLWFERQDGTIRKHFADRVLREALEALPETAQFNLIPYTKEPHPWQPRLVKATRANVRKAIAWFEACDENGSGNVFDAAMLALEDPAVESIVCLTDGAPTGGAHWKLELIVPLLVDAARFSCVSIDSVLIAAPKGLARRWAELARLTGGTSRNLEASKAK